MSAGIKIGSNIRRGSTIVFPNGVHNSSGSFESSILAIIQPENSSVEVECESQETLSGQPDDGSSATSSLKDASPTVPISPTKNAVKDFPPMPLSLVEQFSNSAEGKSQKYVKKLLKSRNHRHHHQKFPQNEEVEVASSALSSLPSQRQNVSSGVMRRVLFQLTSKDRNNLMAAKDRRSSMMNKQMSLPEPGKEPYIIDAPFLNDDTVLSPLTEVRTLVGTPELEDPDEVTNLLSSEGKRESNPDVNLMNSPSYKKNVNFNELPKFLSRDLEPPPKKSAMPRRAFSLRFGLGRSSRRGTSDNSTAARKALGNSGNLLKPTAPDIVITDSSAELGENASVGSAATFRKRGPMTPSRTSSVRYHIEAFFEVSDNRLAMKLFGNRRALDREKERQQNSARFVIHPCSKFRFYWDLVMLLLLLTNMILLPVAIAFFSDDFMQPGWLTFNCFSDTFFILDIIINFRTGIIANEPGSEFGHPTIQVVLEPREIALYYLKTWFFIDFISSIPVDYIFIIVVFVDGREYNSNASLLHAGRAFRVMRLAKLLGLLRLLRLSRLVRYINQWQEFLNVATMVLRISNLIGLTFLLAHWNGCLQYLVPTLQGYPENSWVTKRGIQNASWSRQYTLSLFRALSHMLSIGYGQDIPDTTAEVWLTIGSMLAGATCYAIFVGHMTNLIHSYDSSRRMYTEKLKQVQEYMFYRKLPRSLRDRITDYYEHRYQGKMFDEVGIMAELSQSLREDVISYNCRVLIQRVPFFENAEPSFLSDVLTKLKPELFQPSDFIIKEGTIGKRMYFIQDGAVDIVKHNDIATTLTEGSYFGEICLLTNTRRCASVRAVAYCQLFSLHKDDFEEVLHYYPVMKRTLKGIAAQRLYKIGENPRLVSKSGELAEVLNTAHEILNDTEGMSVITRPVPNIPEDDSVSMDDLPFASRSHRRLKPNRAIITGFVRDNQIITHNPAPLETAANYEVRQNHVNSNKRPPANLNINNTSQPGVLNDTNSSQRSTPTSSRD